VRLALLRGDGKSDSRVSDGDGRFAFSLREAGDFQLLAEKKGWAAQEQAVSVRAGAPASSEIRLQPSRHVVVDVVNPRGERVPGVRLEVRPPAGFVAKFQREDLAGRFHFDDLPPVASTLRMFVAGEWQERPIDPLVPELRIESTWDEALVPVAGERTSTVLALRSVAAPSTLLTCWNLEETPGVFPVVRPGEYTLGFESYRDAHEGSKETWTPVHPPVPVHVEADRTTTVHVP